MKIDLSKVEEIIIKNDKGEVEDRFFLSSAALIKNKLTGTYLELKKAKSPSSEKNNIGKCYCGQPVDTTNPDCVDFNLCAEHADDV